MPPTSSMRGTGNGTKKFWKKFFIGYLLDMQPCRVSVVRKASILSLFVFFFFF